MAIQTNLCVDYVSRQDLTHCPPPWWQSVLGIAAFAAAPELSSDFDIPIVPVGLQELGTTRATCEVWRAGGPLSSGHTGRVHYRAGECGLFGRVVIAESDPSISGNGDPTTIQSATSEAYAEIFAAMDRLGYPHLLRIWNYLPDINQKTPQGERYRQFNSARRKAFLRSQRAVQGEVPAASALGSTSGNPLIIYFLASPTPGRAIESPRQTSAYRYPSEYGPASPTFSRAVISPWLLGECLLISGTASIVGHRTVHVGDVTAQTGESMENISALVDAANDAIGRSEYSIDALRYKVYVRHARDLEAVRRKLANRLCADLPVAYLQADICRDDLLVEIEAFGRPISWSG